MGRRDISPYFVVIKFTEDEITFISFSHKASTSAGKCGYLVPSTQKKEEEHYSQKSKSHYCRFDLCFQTAP